MMDYYPYQLSISAINKKFIGLDLVDEDEEQRLQDVADKKKRGKGAPKKAKSAGKLIVHVSVRLAQTHRSSYSRQSPCTKKALMVP
jgi:hypothetical protein